MSQTYRTAMRHIGLLMGSSIDHDLVFYYQKRKAFDIHAAHQILGSFYIRGQGKKDFVECFFAGRPSQMLEKKVPREYAHQMGPDDICILGQRISELGTLLQALYQNDMTKYKMRVAASYREDLESLMSLYYLTGQDCTEYLGMTNQIDATYDHLRDILRSLESLDLRLERVDEDFWWFIPPSGSNLS